MNYGYIPSKLDGTEKKFAEVKGLEIPEEYSYINYLPRIINQGERPICVPCSLSAYLNWNKNVDTDGQNKRDNNIRLIDIYSSKTTKGNGMTFKDALRYLRHNGVDSDLGNLKIDQYAMVGNKLSIQQALLLNGPLVGALPVYNTERYFWRKNSNNDRFQGAHAIAIVGYDRNGMIIRNSWGSAFGNNGYTHINWDELDNFYEIWTMIA